MAANPSSPLQQARQVIDRFSLRIRVLSWIPLPLLAASATAVQYFDPRWYSNAVLAAMLALFAGGQFVAVSQFRRLRRNGCATASTLDLLTRMEAHSTPAAFREAVLALPSGHARNLVLSWIDLGVRNCEERGIQILDNARERRDLDDGKILGFHVSVNRNILKLGFLGTLVGLLLTFPPMRAAVMGLGDSGGEMKFINDIAAAIDEDAYAIQATLISMGFSFLLEAVVVQLLERLLLSFQLVDSHLADWYILSLLPWLRRHDPEHETASARTSATEAASKAHLEFVATEHRRLSQSAREAEREAARRADELADFEKRYRTLLPTEAVR